jgi:hypothetical protein
MNEKSEITKKNNKIRFYCHKSEVILIQQRFKKKKKATYYDDKFNRFEIDESKKLNKIFIALISNRQAIFSLGFLIRRTRDKKVGISREFRLLHFIVVVISTIPGPFEVLVFSICIKIITSEKGSPVKLYILSFDYCFVHYI